MRGVGLVWHRIEVDGQEDVEQDWRKTQGRGEWRRKNKVTIYP